METIYRYNENNQLVSETDGMMEQTYKYDRRGNLSKVLSGREVVREFIFGAANQMDRAESYADGVRQKAEYVYNGLGKRVSQSIYAGDGNPRREIQYMLDLTRDYYNLLGLHDNAGQKQQRFVWDGNVAGMEADGVKNYYLQDDLGSVLELVKEDGESLETWGYEEFGQVRNRSREHVQPFLFTGYQMDETSGLYFAQARRYARYSYDARGNVTQVMDALGNKTNAIYDAKNHLISLKVNGNKTSFTYDDADQITSVVNPAGNRRTYEYNQRGRITKVVDFDGYCLEATYNCLNRPERVTDKEVNVTRYEYDSMWNVSAKITPDGARTEYVYNRANRLEQVLLPNEGCIAYEYDAAGNQTGMTDAEGNHYVYEYDERNRMISVTEPDGARTTYEYDAEDHVIYIIDAMKHMHKFAYDEMGRRIHETDLLGNETSYSYTALGDIKEVTYPNGSKVNVNSTAPSKNPSSPVY